MRNIFFVVLVSLCFVCSGVGQVRADQGVYTVDYSLWAQVLDGYVNDQGRIDYAGLKKDRGKLNQFVTHLQTIDPEGLPEDDRKAFWINAYNALTVQTVVENYPVKSIRHINFGLVWKLKKNVAQGKYSLDDIEHKILRPQGDPRVHFVLNCASTGCPKLPRKPFYPATLEEQLAQEASKFINDPGKVRLDRSEDILYYSSILKWYEKDFLAVALDILSYIKLYLNKEDLTYLENHEIKLKVLSYGWGLNEQE